MKVMIFMASLPSGGAERQIVELIKGLNNKNGVKFELVLMSKEIHYVEVFDTGVPIHYLIRQSRFDIGIFWRFFKLCKKVNPDVIHSWNSMCSVYAVPTILFKKIYFINGFLRNAPPAIKRFSKLWLRSATFFFSDVVLSNSKAGLKAYSVPERKAKCIYNGFDFKRIEKLPTVESVKESLGVDTDLVVGMVASFSSHKDYKTFIAVAKRLITERGDVTFLAIGGGNDLDSCKNLVPENLKKRIKFLGRRHDVEALMQACDIGVLLSSPIHGEGISNTIMEFMSLGKPVVASDSGGNSELVAPGKTGFIVGVQDEESAYKQVKYLIENKAERLEMGEKGRELLTSQFNLNVMTDKYFDLYCLFNRYNHAR